MRTVTGDFELDDDRARVDLDALWDFLSTSAYWGRWRVRDQVVAQVTTAWRVIGAYERASGRMVGFARAFSDGVMSAYLADVYVHEAARGHGPGATMRWMLHTDDAHELYARFGFAKPDATYLERPARR